MNAHRTVHSLVPVYAAISRIQKLSVDGQRSGKIDLFIDITAEANEALAHLMMIEKDLGTDVLLKRL